MDDIALAAGISRRTVFRYYASKNDIVWGDFEAVRARLRRHLDESPPGVELGTALRRAVVLSNRYPPEEQPELRARMTVITQAPALQSHSLLRYEQWCGDVAAFIAARLGVQADDLVPQAIAQATMATAMAAFRHWVSHQEAVLEHCLVEALAVLVTHVDELGR